MPLHSNLTDPEIHEPKGVAAAAANRVYVSDGSGSGSWTAQRFILHVFLSDISTAGTVYVPMPYSGNIVKITSVINNTIGVADEVITFKDAADASMGSITITQVGSAPGVIDTLSPISNNSFTADTALKIEVAGDSSTTASASLAIVVERS